MENKNINIKIVFSNEYEGNALSFDEFENAIVDAIKDCKKVSFRVFLRNPMPLTELDNVIRELCQRIELESDFRTTVFRENECFGEKEHHGVIISGLVSAIYYVEIRKIDCLY